MQRFLLLIFLFLFLSCSKHYEITKTTTNSYSFKTDSSAIDSSIIKLTAPYKQQLDVTMNVVIGSNAKLMEKDKPESSLGNFMVDACFIQANKNYHPVDSKQIDFCFLNYGGIRIPAMAEGDITIGKVYEMMPFENELAVLTLNGSDLIKLFNYFGIKGDNPVSNITYKINNQQLKEVKINGKPFNSDAIYKVVTSDYLAGGGDNLDFLKNAINKELINLKVRDAIIKYVQSLTETGKKIESKKDGRVSYE